MKKKEFALMKLLLVIILLDLLALITMPVINDIYKQTRLHLDKSNTNLENKELNQSEDNTKSNTVSNDNKKTENSVEQKKDTSKAKAKDSEKHYDLAFNTVELMKSNNSITNRKIVKTKGFYSINDGGGAYYEITNESLTPDDITIIELNNGLYAKLIYQDKMNIKQFGAKGDGVSDDTTFVKKAFSKSGYTIYVPKGTYVMYDKTNVASNIVIIGEGEKSLFIAAPGTAPGKNVFDIRERNDILIKKIAISGNISVNTKEKGHSDQDGIHLMDLWTTSNVTIDEVTFKDNVYAGIRFMLGTTNLKVINSKFLNVDCGVIALGSGNIEKLLIENNLFDGHQNSEPISLYGTGKYNNITINKNTIRNKQYASGIFIRSTATTTNITISNNKINNVATGIVLGGATNGVVKNNTIDNSELSINKTGGSGIIINNSNKVDVYGNKVSNITQFCFSTSNNENVNVYNNKFENCGYANDDFVFVILTGTNNHVKVYKNDIIRSDTSLVNRVVKFNINSDGSGTTEFTNNNIVNGKLWIMTNAKGYIIKNNNNSAILNNSSESNVIEQ